MDVETNLPLVCAWERSLPFTWLGLGGLSSSLLGCSNSEKGAFAMVRIVVIVGGEDTICADDVERYERRFRASFHLVLAVVGEIKHISYLMHKSNAEHQ